MIAYKRIGLILFCLSGLLTIYVSQRFDYARYIFMDPISGNFSFAANRAIRLILNDLLCLLLIHELFRDARFSRIGIYVFLVELLLLLPLYLVVKLTMEGPSEISSPLLSPIHRMIINPLLMIILMAGFYYEKMILKK